MKITCLFACSKSEHHPNSIVDFLFSITSDQSPLEAAPNSARLFHLSGSQSCGCPDAPAFSEQPFLILFTCHHHHVRTKNKEFLHPYPALMHSNFFSRPLYQLCQQNKADVDPTVCAANCINDNSHLSISSLPWKWSHMLQAFRCPHKHCELLWWMFWIWLSS